MWWRCTPPTSFCHYSHQGRWAPQRPAFSLPAAYQKEVFGSQGTTPTSKERRPSVQTPGTFTGGPNSPARTSFPEAGKGLSAEVPQLYWPVWRALWRPPGLSNRWPRTEAYAQRCPAFPGRECDCRRQKLSEAEKIVCLSQWHYCSSPISTQLYFFCCCSFFFLIFIFTLILLYNTVLVLPYIDMNPPRVYMRSQTWTLLPPPSLQHPSGSSPCTSPKHAFTFKMPIVWYFYNAVMSLKVNFHQELE